MSSNAVVLITLAATLFLTGLSWFLQIVHLPLLSSVDLAFSRRRNTLLMAGPMLIELITAILLWTYGVALLLVVIIWLITFLRHIPLYRQLIRVYDPKVFHTLTIWH